MYIDDRVASSLTQQEGRGDGIEVQFNNSDRQENYCTVKSFPQVNLDEKMSIFFI